MKLVVLDGYTENPDWCYWDYPLIEPEGKTMGIIGFGRIGQTEGCIVRTLGMDVLAYDVRPNDTGRAIAKMKGGTILINNVRGQLIVEQPWRMR